MIVRFLRPAQREFAEAVHAYNLERAGLGDEFRDAVEEAVRHITEFPDAWHLLSGLLRRCRTRRFPYAIIYERGNEEILIVAVAHLRRKPNYWQPRQR